MHSYVWGNENQIYKHRKRISVSEILYTNASKIYIIRLLKNVLFTIKWYYFFLSYCLSSSFDPLQTITFHCFVSINGRRGSTRITDIINEQDFRNSAHLPFYWPIRLKKRTERGLRPQNAEDHAKKLVSESTLYFFPFN